jgi:hypothetical protein
MDGDPNLPSRSDGVRWTPLFAAPASPPASEPWGPKADCKNCNGTGRLRTGRVLDGLREESPCWCYGERPYGPDALLRAAPPESRPSVDAREVLREMDWQLRGSRCVFCDGHHPVKVGLHSNEHDAHCRIAAALNGGSTP